MFIGDYGWTFESSDKKLAKLSLTKENLEKNLLSNKAYYISRNRENIMYFSFHIGGIVGKSTFIAISLKAKVLFSQTIQHKIDSKKEAADIILFIADYYDKHSF